MVDESEVENAQVVKNEGKKIFLSNLNNGVLCGVLGVLVVVIVGLVVGLIVTNNAKNTEVVAAEPQVDTQAVEAENARIKSEMKTAIASMKMSEKESYLNKKIKEYQGTDMEFEARMMKVWIFIEDKQGVKAMEVINKMKIDDEALSPQQKLNYYDTLRGAAKAMNDHETEAAWEEVIAALREQYPDLGETPER